MSIWGKIIGGTTGFALGGPIGALLGLAAGHGMDRVNKSSQSYNRKTASKYSENKNYKEQVFASGVIVIAAKLAKSDGQVTSIEIETFKKIFEFPKEDEKGIAELFNAAKKDTNGYQIYASQLYEEFKSNNNLLNEILSSLFAIAYADGNLHPNEEKMLLDISNIFKFDKKEYESIHNLYSQRDLKKTDKLPHYYKILGVKESDSMKKINEEYKRIVKDYHPDRLQGLGLPKDFLELANNKMVIINEAYNKIKKSRQ